MLPFNYATNTQKPWDSFRKRTPCTSGFQTRHGSNRWKLQYLTSKRTSNIYIPKGPWNENSGRMGKRCDASDASPVGPEQHYCRRNEISGVDSEQCVTMADVTNVRTSCHARNTAESADEVWKLKLITIMTIYSNNI